MTQHQYQHDSKVAPRPPMLSRIAVATLMLALLLLSSCGGRGVSTTASPSPTGSSASPAPNLTPAPAPVNAPTVINVSAGQSVSGVDINVSSPAGSPSPNAEMLGVAPVGQSGSASNVGDQIHRGSTMKVLLFGPGLSGTMDITISGPSDITVSNVRSITSVDRTTGVAFDATVAASAALGARTVRLRSANNDITTFTGGLEVVP